MSIVDSIDPRFLITERERPLQQRHPGEGCSWAWGITKERRKAQKRRGLIKENEGSFLQGDVSKQKGGKEEEIKMKSTRKSSKRKMINYEIIITNVATATIIDFSLAQRCREQNLCWCF